MKFCQFVLKILSGNEILGKSRAITLVKMWGKMSCDNPNVNLVNLNAFLKFVEILSVSSQENERKGNFGINQGP